MTSACLAQDNAAQSLSVQADAPHWHIGAGVAQFDLHSAYPSPGLHEGTDQLLSLEISTASRKLSTATACESNNSLSCEMPYYPADSSEYFNLLMGVHLEFQLGQQPHMRPWVATGLAYQVHRWEPYWYNVDGSGPYLGAGLNFSVGDRWDLRFEINSRSYDNSDNYGADGNHSRTTQFDAALACSF